MNECCFADLGLAEPLLRALTARNHVTPTPIQAKAIPQLLAGSDMLGIAQTGTGKTAAFALPILHQLSQPRGATAPRGPRLPRALIMAPTRELASQIAEEFRAYGKHVHLRQTVIFGGVSQKPQVNALTRGIDIIIATPGRLLDLMNQQQVKLDAIEFVVLDEADRMLDMGFIHDVKKIISALPRTRQSLLFSATMGKDVFRLSGDILSDPVRVEVTPQATPIARIEQSVYHVDQRGKRRLLSNILEDPALSRVIVFTRTKHRANRVAEQLDNDGVDAEAIHGNKSQGARQRALKRFSSGDARVLVATDIAARGIDVDAVTHVINFELPNEPESYIHRIGRTARAGAGGIALSFCDQDERAYLKDIERLIKQRLTVIGDAPQETASASNGASKNAQPRGRGNNHRPGNRSSHPKRKVGSEGESNEARPKRRRPRNKPVSANDSSQTSLRRKRAA